MGKAGPGWDETFDVLVAGSGAGAMTGAFVAAAGGLRTAVLEKTALLGGTSAYSGAAAWLPGSQVQRRADLEDSTESARTYLKALLGDETEAHREAFLATAPEVVEFLERDPSIEFEFQPFPDYFDAPGRLAMGRSFIPRALPAEALGELAGLVRPVVDRDRAGLGHDPAGPLDRGRALIGRLLLAFTKTGNGTVRTGTAVTGLIVEDGRVVGVEAQTADGPLRLRAERGVLLAAGGFENNAAERAEHGVAGAADWTMAPGGNTGQAIAAAVRIGAATGGMDQAWWCPGTAMPDGRGAFTLGLRGGLMVDGSGRRFANECLPYDRMGREMAAAPDRLPAHLVFDSRTKGGLPAISMPEAPAAEHLAAGTWVKADTLDELAERIGVPAGQLAATVERFNGFAEKGVDEDFHRGEDPYDRFFAAGKGPNPCLVPVDRAPYYAARMILSDLGTKGGLRTDPDARVLDERGRPIAGLYAAGNTSASFTGPFYPAPGVPIGSAMAFAYRAVQDLEKDA